MDINSLGGAGNVAIMAGIGTYMLSQFRNNLINLCKVLYCRYVSSITVNSGQEEFVQLSTFIADHYQEYGIFKSNNFRTTNISTSWGDKACAGEENTHLQLGAGTYYLKSPTHGLMRISVTIRPNTSPGSHQTRRAGADCDLAITILTRDRNAIYSLVKDAFKYLTLKLNVNQLYCYDKAIREWVADSKNIGRVWDSVILPAEQKSRILTDVMSFFKNKDVYNLSGIPHRRGLMLYGLPGTGKTSLVKALQSHCKLPLYSIELQQMSDSGLMDALKAIKTQAIVLIEDVDVCATALLTSYNKHRINGVKPTDKNNGGDSEGGSISSFDTSQLTLSGFLNAVDGVATPENLYIIYTSNAPTTLDKAIRRRGRIDTVEHIDYLDKPLQEQLIRHILNELPVTTLPKKASACDVQEACLNYLLHGKSVFPEIKPLDCEVIDADMDILVRDSI